MHLHPCGAAALVEQLGGQPGLGVQRQYLLDLEAGHLQSGGRQPEGLAAGGQRDLGEAGAGHDRLAVDLVVGQPRVDVGADVGLPDVGPAGGQLDVQPEQRGALR